MPHRLRAAALTIAAALAGACGGSGPTEPWNIAVVHGLPSIAGTWRGHFEILSCTGERLDCDGASVRDFSLALTAGGRGVEGLLALEDDERTTVDITGVKAADGSYQFDAATYDYPGVYPEHTVLRDLVLREEPGAGLTGSFSYTTTTTFRTYTRTVTVRSATREPGFSVSPGNFQGRWEGHYRIRSCSGDCPSGLWYWDDETGGNVSASFAQAGGEVIGTVMFYPVSGTATTSTLSVTGEPLSADLCTECWDCEGECGGAVRNFTARVDKLGRLTGTFEYSRKAWFGGKKHVRQTLVVDLSGMTRAR